MVRQESRAWHLAMGSLAWGPLSSCLQVRIPAQFQRVKETLGLVPHWNQTELRNLGNSAKWNHHSLPSLSITLQCLMLNENIGNTIFFRKDEHFLVISKLWSHCTYFVYQVIFQCQDLFCFTLPSHHWFKSCSWHQGILRVLSRAARRRLFQQQELELKPLIVYVKLKVISLASAPGSVPEVLRVYIYAVTTNWPWFVTLGN